MKRWAPSIAVAVVLAAGCSGSDTSRETSGERIVTLTAGLTEAVFALGAGDLVVARDISSTIDEADALPIVTTAHDINVEALLAVRPTLILIDEDTGPETALDQIEATGVRIELVDNATTVDDIIPRLERVAEILGLDDRAARLSDAIS
ncbi:MAG: hypothetical protein RIU67_1211, partial [Actinomycetota bacterium]